VGKTVKWGLPWPELDNSADGPLSFKALATATDAALSRVSAETDVWVNGQNYGTGLSIPKSTSRTSNLISPPAVTPGSQLLVLVEFLWYSDSGKNEQAMVTSLVSLANCSNTFNVGEVQQRVPETQQGAKWEMYHQRMYVLGNITGNPSFRVLWTCGTAPGRVVVKHLLTGCWYNRATK
jgi:hypothetical protein